MVGFSAPTLLLRCLCTLVSELTEDCMLNCDAHTSLVAVLQRRPLTLSWHWGFQMEVLLNCLWQVPGIELVASFPQMGVLS